MSLIASYYAPDWTLHVFDGMVAVIFGFYGFNHTEKMHVVAATTFVGAISASYSINLFTEGKIGIGGNDGVQAACILVFGYLGHFVQIRLTKDIQEINEEIAVAATNGDFVEF